jgi:superfamily II DNA or RNA helicase
VFISPEVLADSTWRAYERLVCRLAGHLGFSGIRAVGQTNDGGADLIAHRGGKRWLFQIKRLGTKVGPDVVDRTLQAVRTYRADVPVVVSAKGFTDAAREQQLTLQRERIPLQLWDKKALLDRVGSLRDQAEVESPSAGFQPRSYQENAIQLIVEVYLEQRRKRGLVVMATGLGKTLVAAEAIRRLRSQRPALKVLVIAHTNELVYQLEKSFWPFLRPSQGTIVWNGYEKPTLAELERTSTIFACLPTVAEHIGKGRDLPDFDLILIDECHHVGAAMYEAIIRETKAGSPQGPFLLGLTATPWRADEVNLNDYFGDALITMDLVAGLRNGFLTNVDYRMYTDNIDWERLSQLHGARLSPRAVNRNIFVTGWNDAVVLELQRVWTQQTAPRALVFCGTIEHALLMTDKINALGFCRAAAIHSESERGRVLAPYERNRILSDFDDGRISVICAVDIFNEGIDVPDVNIIVFQRVTHSRRIFIQQLGRGLRLAPGKNRVIVLDFVSDIRRFAAGLDLKDELGAPPRAGEHREIVLGSSVSFRRIGGADPQTENFLRQWLDDVAAIEGAGEDSSVLKFPPVLPGSKL